MSVPNKPVKVYRTHIITRANYRVSRGESAAFRI